MQRMEQFGFTSMAPDGSDAVLLSLNGNRDSVIAIGFMSPDNRPTGGEAGSTTIYDINGNSITLVGGGVNINSPSQIVLTAPEIALDGNVSLGGGIGSGVPISKEGTIDTGNFVDKDGLATKVRAT